MYIEVEISELKRIMVIRANVNFDCFIRYTKCSMDAFIYVCRVRLFKCEFIVKFTVKLTADYLIKVVALPRNNIQILKHCSDAVRKVEVQYRRERLTKFVLRICLKFAILAGMVSIKCHVEVCR